MNVKKNDTVVVLSGKDKGKQGKVLSVDPKAGKVVVEKINMVSRHQKPRKQGEEGGVILKEAPLQGHGRLPQVQQGHPGCPQGRGRQEGPCVQALRRRDLRRRRSNKWLTPI